PSSWNVAGRCACRSAFPTRGCSRGCPMLPCLITAGNRVPSGPSHSSDKCPMAARRNHNPTPRICRTNPMLHILPRAIRACYGAPLPNDAKAAILRRAMAALEIQGVSKHFGAILALDDVSLTLNRGEVIGLMGDNGAGKSTLVKIMAGNFRPSHGK